jgi:hypothetical protein
VTKVPDRANPFAAASELTLAEYCRATWVGKTSWQGL